MKFKGGSGEGTFLQYVHGNSLVHQLHPIAKGVFTFSAILVFSLHRSGMFGNIVGILGLVITMFAGKLPIRRIFRGLKSLWLLFLMVLFIHAVSGAPNGVQTGLDALLRMVGIFLCSGVFVMVTSPSELTVFWEACFRPLGILHFPVRESALVMVVAIRFLPVILEEIERIRLAQMARGARFGMNASYLQQAKKMMPLLIPTLVLAIQRAGNLALAMEARCYRLDRPHTRYVEYAWTATDLFFFLTLISLGALIFHSPTL
ncbi:MAG: energy-coupling factor transporter transmembrane component T [Candidatus Ozemobacteraceae bacterium]